MSRTETALYNTTPPTPMQRAYQRRRPEQTPLYRLVQKHLQTFLAQAEAAGGFLVGNARYAEITRDQRTRSRRNTVRAGEKWRLKFYTLPRSNLCAQSPGRAGGLP